MATRRRKSTRRKARRNPVGLGLLNPTRRRRRVVKRRRRNPLGLLNPTRRRTRRYSRRRRNPGLFSSFRRRRRVSRRSNPSGLISKGLVLATFAAVEQFLLMWVPPIGGVSALADAARTAGLGWILGTAMRRTGFLSKYADEATLAGFTLAGGKVITAFILPFASRVFQPSAPAQMPANAQMQGIAMYQPGQQPFRRFAQVGTNGMNGIATYAPGQQPFGQYGALVA